MYTFDTPRPVRVKLGAGAGEVRISAEPVDTSTVEVVALGNSDEAQQAAETTTVVQSGNTIDISVPRARRGLFRNQPKLAINVVVPEGSSVSAKADSADMTLIGTFARVDLSTGSGDLSVEAATESVAAKTGSGDVFAGRCEGTLRAMTGSGDIQVERAIARSLLNTGSGSINLAAVEGVVDTKCGSGDVQVDRLDGELVVKSGSGDVGVREARSGTISASTASGDVAVGVARGTAAWLDLSTVTGDVTNALDDVDTPHESDARLELRARTATGDIAVRRA